MFVIGFSSGFRLFRGSSTKYSLPPQDLAKSHIVIEDLGLEMARIVILCPLSALHQKFLSAVRTATTFVIYFPVRDRAAPQPPKIAFLRT